MTVSVRPEILVSLSAVREDVQRQVASLDRYRALKAIERTIADFPALEDVTRALAGIREQVQRQLDETREYRALQTIDRIMPELSDVLALLQEQATPAGADGPDETGAPAGDDAPAEGHSGAPRLQSTPGFADEFEAVVSVETAEPTAEPVVAARSADCEDIAIRPDGSEFEPGRDDRHATFEVRPAPETAIPSLADSVAQLMAQSTAPPARDAQAQPPQEHGDAMPPHAERAA